MKRWEAVSERGRVSVREEDEIIVVRGKAKQGHLRLEAGMLAF